MHTFDDPFSIRVNRVRLYRTASVQVLQRHKHLISTCAKKRLYDAFLLSCLSYCPINWHYCGKRNSDKLEWINESCCTFGDISISYAIFWKSRWNKVFDLIWLYPYPKAEMRYIF